MILGRRFYVIWAGITFAGAAVAWMLGREWEWLAFLTVLNMQLAAMAPEAPNGRD